MFKINGATTKIPFTSNDISVRVYQSGAYTILETKYFMVSFDGKQFLKFKQCSLEVCGLCGNENENANDDYDFDDYVVNDPERGCLADED
mgnify:CR=1 FL=1